MTVLWATRGRTWGFRFLRTGGLANPLVVYEDAFSVVPAVSSAFQAHDGVTAIRFPDPQGRRDRAGRIILHEFVLTEGDAQRFTSGDDAARTLWLTHSTLFEAIWDAPSPPPPLD